MAVTTKIKKVKSLNKKDKKERILKVIETLKQLYPSAECALEFFGDPWKLLIMGRLSAQCTDARVNIVCRDLFKKYPDAKSMADADILDVEAIVKPCGLYHTKARNLIDSSKMLVEQFGGVVPDDMDTLLLFPGVGRKIANLLLGDIYGVPGIVSDTHLIRICGRLGMYSEKIKDPKKVEDMMLKIVPKDEQTDFCHRIVFFGREYCTARSPKCNICPMSEFCSYNQARENIEM